ncbi:MAG: AI-2E family transporter, partial [Oscillospiraceae bacterium]
IVPPLVSQGQSLVSDFSSIEKFGAQFANFINCIKDKLIENQTPSFIIDNINNLLNKGFEYLTTFLGAIVTGFIDGASKAMNVLIAFVVVVYFLLDGEKLINSFKNFIPLKFKNRVERILTSSDKQLKGYIKAQIIASLAVAGACGIGFWIMGLKYTLILTILTFVLNFIPFFGSIVAGIIAVLVGLFTGGISSAIIVAVFCFVFQQLQGNVLSPILQSDAADIHPVTVLFSLLACSALWGVGGMFIAVPVAGIVKLCFKESIDVISEMK